MCVCIVSHREGDSILFYQREHEHDYSEHDEDNARCAVEGLGLSLVREHCGDARPDEREHDAEDKHRNVGHSAYRKMRYRAG